MREMKLAALIAAGMLAVLMTWSMFTSYPEPVPGRDIGAFYQSIHAWADGETLYDLTRFDVNMNPPHASVLLFWPMLPFSFPSAFAVWAVLQLAASVVAFAIIRRELALSWQQTAWAAVLFTASPASQMNWREGQVGGVLLLLGTLAWRAYRQGASAAPWLAIAASVKPWLVCLIPCLPRRQAIQTACFGTLGIVAGVALMGVQPWVEWFGVMHSHLVHPDSYNLSLLGAIVRGAGQVGLSDTPKWSGAWPLWWSLAVPAAWLTWWRGRTASPDQRWLLYGLCGLLLSPIAWAYYLAAFVGPIAGWWITSKRQPLAVPGLALLIMPQFAVVALIGSAGWSSLSFGAMLLWVALGGWHGAPSPLCSRCDNVAVWYTGSVCLCLDHAREEGADIDESLTARP